MGLFAPALREMDASGRSYSDPESFVSYLRRHGLPERDVASVISIDSLAQLDPDLKKARVMVFRLGAAPGTRTTRFALARSETEDFSDYFLVDETLFSAVPPRLFIPSVNPQALFAFTLLPTFTETSLVNLAVFSGLLGHALGLDAGAPMSAPATGQSIYTFSFSPRADHEPMWEHRSGQVEVDALLTGERNGQQVAVIVESKASRGGGSLAKHKLLYPYLSLRGSIPSNMPILLVYLRANCDADRFHFRIAEYEAKPTDRSIAGIASPADCRTCHLVLPLHTAARP
jgi:hypothetical protein